MSVYFIGGIDTEIGKTLVTGLIGRYLRSRGSEAATMKIVETGVETGAVSADIRTHRRLMGIDLLDEDRDGTTCPYRFRLPASPHLAAAEEGLQIDPDKIVDSIRRLSGLYENVLIEGVGGMLVPLRKGCFAADFLRSLDIPLILVTSGRLGSINHTLLTLEAMSAREIVVAGLVFNRFGEAPEIIQQDTLALFRDYLRDYGRPEAMVEIPSFRDGRIPEIDFSPILLSIR